MIGKVRLGDVATYINGYPFKPTDWSNIGIPIIRIQDLTGNSYQSNRYESEYNKKYEVISGDVLISWSASLGVYIWSGEKALLNQHIFKVVFDKCNINKSYFVHQVSYLLKRSASSAHGATMKHLTKPIFDDLPFYLPSLEEQEKIASQLDCVSGLIAQRRLQMEKLDYLAKLKFIEMFGNLNDRSGEWRFDLLGQHADIITGFPFDSSRYVERGINICGGLIIMPGKIEWENAKKWPDVSGLDKFILNEGDIVIAMDRPWISSGFKIAMIKNSDLPALLIQRTARIRGIDLRQQYILWALKCGSFAKHCNITQTTVPHISIVDVKGYCLPIPSPSLQNHFADFVDQIDKTKLRIQSSLIHLDLLKQSLIQEHFNLDR